MRLKVYQKTQPNPSRLEISNQLGFMHGEKLLHGFYFDDDFFIHNDVESLAAQKMSSVVNFNGFLSDEWNALGRQLDTKGFFVKLLQKPWPQFTMHPKGSIQNLFADALDRLRQRLKTFSRPGFLRHQFFLLLFFVSSNPSCLRG